MNNFFRVFCCSITFVSILSGCVQEEEPLTDNGSDPIGGGGSPPPALQLTAPTARQNEATGPTTVVDLGQATATGGDGTYSYSNDAPANGFPLGLTAVTWTVVDGSGAQETSLQNVTVSDTTAPTINTPADLQVSTTGPFTTVNIGTASATDLVDVSPAIGNDTPAAGFALGTTIVTWTATDASGNAAMGIQSITVVQPSTGPLIVTAPVNITAEATATLSSVILGAALAAGGEPPITLTNDAPAGGFPVGQVTITWTAIDADSTVATDTQSVTVTDTTAPIITAPANVTASQGSGLGSTNVTLGAASASDLADPAPIISSDAPAGGFPVGDTTVIWTATDAHGNSATTTQVVTINAYVQEQCSALLPDFQNTIYPLMDSTSPLTCNGCHTGPAPLTTPNGWGFPNDPPNSADLEVFRTVANIDSGGQSLILVKVRGGATHTGGDRFPNGVNDPNFVTLSDFVDRARGCAPDPIALQLTAPQAVQNEATGPLTTVVLGQATATGGDGSYTYSNDAPANGFPLGLTVITWTVVDGTGTQQTDTQDITVNDTTPPTINQPPDMQVTATGTLTVVNIGTATATDLVDANPTLANDAPAAGFPIGTTAVTWTATDASGNATSVIQMVTVTQPTAGPLAVTAPTDVTMEATAPVTNVVLGAAIATGGQPPITITNNAPVGGFPVGQATVTWTAIDSGVPAATATDTQLVNVTDTTAPNITAPANVVADQGSGLGNTTVTLGNAAANDLADPAPTVSNNAPASGFPVGNTTVVWTALDASGNAATATQLVTINAFVQEQCSALLPDFQNTIYPLMDSTNPLTCNGCHTGPTPLTTPNGWGFPNDPPTTADLEIFRTVANIDSGGQSLILVKVRGGATHSGGDRFPNGTSDPNFVTLSDFVARARSCLPDQTSGNNNVVFGTSYEQLHKVVATLGSRTPTQSEVNVVAVAPDQAAIDVALDGVMDGLMNEPAFYTRVREFYNDLLLTNRNSTAENRVGSNFGLDALPAVNVGYFSANFDNAERRALRAQGNYAVAHAAVELISYVIENNRPFTEILTADYIMVNPYSAVIYGVDAGDPNFPFSSDDNQNNHDRGDFRPVTVVQQVDGTNIPFAGVIGTHSFLARYRSTNTNINRERSRFVFDYFLGVDIEGLAPRDGLDLDNVIGVVPTYEDPQCTVCHQVMDPVAGLFSKRENDGTYEQSNNFQHNLTTSGVPRMVPAGYSLDPADVLPTANEDAPLQWLVLRMAADDRFADRTVRTVLKGLTRIETTTPATTAFINDTKNRFVASNFNFKSLVKDILMSDYFRAQNLDPAENPNNYVDIGLGRLLSAEELDRKITSIAGGNYTWSGPDSGSGLNGAHYLLYGGINSDDVIVRTTTPHALIDSIQERIANQVSCERVAADLYNGGTLFPFADETNTPDNGGETVIRQNIQFLHRHLLGEDLATNSNEINQTYQLFLDARALGESAIQSQCRGGGGSTDVNGTVLPWMAVASYLMTDYRFVYE